MPVLKRSKLYRGGVSQGAKYVQEKTEIILYSGRTDKKLVFQFKLASKGGGTTLTTLEVSPKDVEDVLWVVGEFSNGTELLRNTYINSGGDFEKYEEDDS